MTRKDAILALWHVWAIVNCEQGGETLQEAANIFESLIKRLNRRIKVDQEELALQFLEFMKEE